MIPLALVCGFLGSGKTTLLGELAAANPGVALLVNEFANADIDGAVLRDTGRAVYSVVGGSIFCVCRTGPFIDVLGQLADLHAAGVIIEASGMARPDALPRLLREARLEGRFELRQVLCVADPGTVTRLLATLPAIGAQIEAADVVLLNKCDLYAEGALADAEAAIRGVRGDVPLLRCVRGRAGVDVFRAGALSRLEAEPAAGPEGGLVGFDVSGAGLDAGCLASSLGALGAGVYRAKGFIGRDDRWQLFQLAGGRSFVVPAAGPPLESRRLAVVVSPELEAAARRAIEQCRGSTGRSLVVR